MALLTFQEGSLKPPELELLMQDASPEDSVSFYKYISYFSVAVSVLRHNHAERQVERQHQRERQRQHHQCKSMVKLHLTLQIDLRPIPKF